MIPTDPGNHDKSRNSTSALPELGKVQIFKNTCFNLGKVWELLTKSELLNNELYSTGKPRVVARLKADEQVMCILFNNITILESGCNAYLISCMSWGVFQ